MLSPPALPKWDLTQFYVNEHALEKDISTLQKRVKAFENYRTLLEKKPSRELVEEILRELETTSRISHRAGAYAQLAFDSNTRDEKAKALVSRLSQLGAEWGNKELFFGLWWKSLDWKIAKKFLPKNKDHAYFLREILKMKPHTLGEKEEQLINYKNTTGTGALEKIYSIITNGMRFEWKHGAKTIKISEEELRVYFTHAKPEIRKKAYDVLWNAYAGKEDVLGEIYRSMAQDFWNEEVTLRKFSNPIAVRNIDNNLNDEAVETFLRVCETHAGVFRDYFEWKAKQLRIPNSRYHIYAPLGKAPAKWGFENAYSQVIHTYERFSTAFAREARRVRDAKRLDAALKNGKKGGAYCMGIMQEEPCFVLMNWTGTFHDVSTLAHEMGHAIHAQLAKNRSIFTWHAPLPLAETASTFGEMLLTEKLLEETNSQGFKRYLLSHQLQDAYASIARQAFFTRFEQEAFELVRGGKSTPELSEAYFNNLRTQLGKKMHIPENAKNEWLLISHMFEHPFYTYSYAFGQLLVLAFFERYQKEGESFVRDYTQFLSKGGSEEPEKMLRTMGFDARKKKSWEKGFDILERKLRMLKKTD